jgi:hypothetical protein
VLVAGAKTSLFAKIPAALFLLKKLAENFLTLIARFLPTHFAMCGEKIQKYRIYICRFVANL